MGFRMIFSTIKAKLYIAGVLLVSALLGALKIQSMRLNKAQQKSKDLQMRVDLGMKVMKEDVKIEKKFNSRRAEAKDEIKNTGGSKSFRNPASLRKPRNP